MVSTLCFCGMANLPRADMMVVLCGTAYVALVSEVLTSADWVSPNDARGASLPAIRPFAAKPTLIHIIQSIKLNFVYPALE